MAALKAENTILAQMIILLFETEIICSAYCSTVRGPHTYSFHHSSLHVTWDDLICFAFGVMTILQWESVRWIRNYPRSTIPFVWVFFLLFFLFNINTTQLLTCSEMNVCRILPATTRERVSTRVSKLRHIAYDPNNPNRQYQSHSLLILGLGGSMGPSVLS